MELPIVNKEYKGYRDYSYDRKNQGACWIRFAARINRSLPFPNETKELDFLCFMHRRLPVFFRYPELRKAIKKSREWELLQHHLPYEKEFFEALDRLPFMPYPAPKRR